MDKLPCSVARDLLPLYIDKALSPETFAILETHLDACPACRGEYETMIRDIRLPIHPDLQLESGRALKNFRHRWRKKYIRIALLSFALAVSLFFCGLSIYQNVDFVHDFFSPTIACTLGREAEGQWSEQWRTLSPNGKEYLNFDSRFFRRKLVADINNETTVCLRILDQRGTILMDNLYLGPGSVLYLDFLDYHTDYIVQYKTGDGFCLLRFV